VSASRGLIIPGLFSGFAALLFRQRWLVQRVAQTGIKG
jgi:hypothetical protein